MIIAFANKRALGFTMVWVGAAALVIGCGGSGVSAPSVSVATPFTTTGTTGTPNLGMGANMNGYVPFPATNPWNTAVDTMPVDPNSANLIASIGVNTGLHPDFGANWNGGPFGIPYMVVAGTQPKVPMIFSYAVESDLGPYPFPPNAPVEDASDLYGDRHVLVIDRDNKELYETYASYKQVANEWKCSSGAKFNLTSNALRPLNWTSADAAGLPIFPGLVRYDECVLRGAINHALRFTVAHTQKKFVSPARHYASTSTNPNLPPMGMRVRLKANFDISKYPAPAQVVLKCLKKYGMMVADNGSNWYISGAPDSRWDDDVMSTLKNVKGSNFEVIKMP